MCKLIRNENKQSYGLFQLCGCVSSFTCNIAIITCHTIQYHPTLQACTVHVELVVANCVYRPPLLKSYYNPLREKFTLYTVQSKPLAYKAQEALDQKDVT